MCILTFFLYLQDFSKELSQKVEAAMQEDYDVQVRGQ